MQTATLTSLHRPRCVLGFDGRIVFNATKPDGAPRKLLVCAVLTALGWTARTPLREGIALAHADILRKAAVNG